MVNQRTICSDCTPADIVFLCPLHAAASEMLVFVRQALSYLTYYEGKEPTGLRYIDIIESARALIARIEGN